jgi:adenosylcobinamide kinase/adenosylcobinamide-phosphate guanylyltransferase
VSIVLIGGGSRSGKTRHALAMARARGRKLAFLATAQALDDEMRERIAAHRLERGIGFTTIEEPIELPDAVERHSAAFDTMVVDCLTLWLSNLIVGGGEIPTDRLIAVSLKSAAEVIFVTNEVGSGIVPDNELGRRFRDEAGWMNQKIAEAAAEVYWMIFGCPLRVK